MKKSLFAVVLALLVFSCHAHRTNIQRSNAPSQILYGSFDDAFEATMTVLQDKGYTIEHNDFISGTIKGICQEQAYDIKSCRSNIRVKIEKYGDKSVRERITLVHGKKTKKDPYATHTKDEIIHDPQYVNILYKAIQQEIASRSSIK